MGNRKRLLHLGHHSLVSEPQLEGSILDSIGRDKVRRLDWPSVAKDKHLARVFEVGNSGVVHWVAKTGQLVDEGVEHKILVLVKFDGNATDHFFLLTFWHLKNDVESQCCWELVIGGSRHESGWEPESGRHLSIDIKLISPSKDCLCSLASESR